MMPRRTCIVSVALALVGSFGCGSGNASAGNQTAGQTGGAAATGTETTTTTSTSTTDAAKGGTSAGATRADSSSSGGSSSTTHSPSDGGTSSVTSAKQTSEGTSATQGGSTTLSSGGSRLTERGGTSSKGGTGPTGDGGSVAKGGNAPKGGASSSSITANTTTGGSGTGTVCTEFATPTKVGTMQSGTLASSSELNQISGIVASRENANVIYALSDSDANSVYAMDEAGKPLGAIKLSSVTPEDWEGLSIGVTATGTDYIYVADIGDNNSTRTSIAVYRFKEPAKSSLSTSTAVLVSDVEVAKLVYPAAVHNAEGHFVDPKTQDIIITTKDTDGKAVIYRAPDTAFGASGATTIEQVAQITIGASGQNSQISAADISPSGDVIILRAYGSILLFPRLSTWKETFAAAAVTVPSATEKQGEGITFNNDGTAWLSAGELSTDIYKGVANCK